MTYLPHIFVFLYNTNMYNFQKQDSTQTLEEGLQEFYSINLPILKN